MYDKTIKDVLEQLKGDPHSGTNQDRLNFLIDLNITMFKKMFIADNGDPSMIEQVHLNSEHRKEAANSGKFRKQTILSSLIGGIVAAILSIVLFLTLGIN